MKNLLDGLTYIVILLLFFYPLTGKAQSSDAKKFAVDAPSFKTEYGLLPGNNMKEIVSARFPKWEADATEAEVFITIQYIEGLQTKQYTIAKTEGGHTVYKVIYQSPSFQAIVKNKSGNILLDKIYPDQKIISHFGANLRTKSASTIATSWREHKETFYQYEEQRTDHYDVFLDDLESLFPLQTTSLRNDPPINADGDQTVDGEKNPAPDTNTGTEDDADTYVDNNTITEPEPIISKNNRNNKNKKKNKKPKEETDPTTPTTEANAHYRQYRKVLSIGVGGRNLRDYKLRFPSIGGSIDRYSFDDLFNVDWFFVGGWIGYGQYKYNSGSGEGKITELSFISRYGVSASRILQDAGHLTELTNLVDIYALIQFGYSLVNVDDLIILPVSSGTNAGISIGGRVSKDRLGAFIEIGKTETGFIKVGALFQL